MPSQLDLADIQGNVLAGFNTDVQILLGFTAPDVAGLFAAADWAASLASSITTVADVRAVRGPMKAASAQGPIWLAIGLGNRLMSTTQPDTVIYDEAFQAGMLVRAPSVLGDFTDPRTWAVGSQDDPLDILLIVASNHDDPVQRRAQELIESAKSADLFCSYREVGRRINDKEHFGFRDGVSQPRVIGYDADGDTPAAKFLLGVSDADGPASQTAPIDPRNLTANGSLLVFRRLAQDVRKFQAFCQGEVDQLASKWPGLTASQLAAMLVGRWPSGTLMDLSVFSDPSISPPNNLFDFSGDTQGRACPLGAHIRKVNPRKGPRDVVEVPRILRRGIPFGPEFSAKPNAERGLLFLAYQSAIKDQFEFLTSAWMNQFNRPAPSCGNDLLVGRSRAVRVLPINGPQGAVDVVIQDEALNWITPTGGGYLFAPGKAELARFATASSPRKMTSIPRAVMTETIGISSRSRAGTENDGVASWRHAGLETRLVAANWPLTRLDTAASATLADLQSLERLNLSGEYFPTQTIAGDDLEHLHSEVELRELSLHGVTIKAAKIIPKLEHLTSLTALDIRGMDISNSEIMDLAKVSTYLKDLALGTCSPNQKRHCFDASRLTGQAWQNIMGFQDLRRLAFRNNNTNDADIAIAQNLLLRLHSLDIGNTKIGDQTTELLSRSRVLERLIVDGTHITDKGVDQLSEIPTLAQLDISRTGVGQAGVARLLEKGRLIALRLSGLSITDDGLSILRVAQYLEDLDISETNAGSRALAAIATLERLSRVNLDSSRATDSDVRLLAGSSVRDLSLANISLQPQTLEALSESLHLKNLTIRVGSDWSGLASQTATVDLTASTPRSVQLPPRLRKLFLQGDLNAALRDALGKLDSFEQLLVTGRADLLSGIKDSGFPVLRTLMAEAAGLDDRALDRLSRLPNLQELFISGNGLSQSVCRLQSPFLNTLELRHTNVDDTCIQALASLPRLHCLDIPFTNVTPEGVVKLVSAAGNLQSFAVDGTQITEASVDALFHLSTLVELYLYGKAVTDDILKQLQPLTALRELNLYDTSVTDSAVASIAVLVGLRTLRLDGTQFSPAGYLALQKSRPDIKIYRPDASGRSILNR
jgi:Dyp-type peroxidase family